MSYVRRLENIGKNMVSKTANKRGEEVNFFLLLFQNDDRFKKGGNDG